MTSGTGTTAGWRARMAGWTSPFTAPVPERVRAPLIRLQQQRLAASLPLLCLAVAASAVAMALAVLGDLPLWQQLAPPILIVGTCLFLLLRIRLRPPPADLETAYRSLRGALFVAIGLGAVAGAWCVNAFVEMERYYCMTAPVFIGIGALVTASSLIAVPRAAIAGMGAAVAPIVLKLASYDYLGMRAMAAMMVLITLLQARMILGKFRETVSMLTAQQELDRLARFDALTGLAGRRAFMDDLQARLDAGRPVLVALADLDRFKQANDLHGHKAGDAVLIAVAERLRGAAPGAATIARLGGDEFALLFDGAEERAGAELAAVRRAVARPFAPGGGASLSIGISIGVAASPRGGTDLATLLHDADLAMYADKAAGKARETPAAPRRAAA
ncbi:MAG TPA: diguanylate cyclase [Allosphingosinicella sp.]|nr:diguanylate cyclase [Allosphingosinicella sp.]